MESTEKKKSLISELWERRFFQYLATYVGICWGILQFLQFGVNRYQWNSSLIDMFLLFALLMIPAVSVFIYNHGKAGDDDWLPFEKWFIPANTIAAVVLAFFSMSSTASENAKSEIITLTTDEGNTITRSIPNLEYAKRLVIFPMVNEHKAEEINWLRFGMSSLMYYDITQDTRISAFNPFSLDYYYKSYSQDVSSDIPTGTKLEISRDLYVDYYIDGMFSINEGKYNFTINVKNANDGSNFFTKEYSGDNYFNIVDNFTTDLNERLYSKEFFEPSDIADLPASELISPNEECLKAFINGNLSSTLTNELNTAQDLLNQSIVADPNCAICYFVLSSINASLNQPEESLENIDKAMLHASSQTERNRLEIRLRSYSIKRDTDKSKKLLETWMQLYPHDSRPYSRLMAFSNQIQDRTTAIEIGEKAIENGLKGTFYTDLADTYIATGNYQRAEELLKKFFELYPSKAKDNTQLGDILMKQGKISEGIKFYEDQEIIAGESYQNTLKIATAQSKLGEFDNALKTYQNAFTQCKQTADSLDIYQGLRRHYLYQGQAEKAIETYKVSEKVAAGIMPKLIIDANMFMAAASDYLAAQQLDVWLEEGNSRFANEQSEQDLLIRSIMKYLYAMNMSDIPMFEESYAKIGDFYQKTVGPSYAIFNEGMEAKLKGEYPLAVEKLEEYVSMTNSDYTAMSDILCDVYLGAGQPEKALDYANNVLKMEPVNPTFLLVNIKSNHALDNKSELKKSRILLEKTLANADPTFLTLAKYNKFISENSLDIEP